jgi:hypothetical protein
MKTIKSSILSVSLGLLALSGVQSFSALAQEPQAQPPQQAQQDPAKSQTFTGTIVRDGQQFSLRDGSGAMFKLDDSTKAQPFEGKQVKVTGRLDTDAKLIHVDAIEGVAA